MTELERKFTCDMEELCRIAKKECGYNCSSKAVNYETGRDRGLHNIVDA